MRRLIILFFLLAFSQLPVLAQEATHEIEIIGEIVDKDSNEPVPYVHIINENNRKGTVSNEQGRFWMKMSKSDTLTVSAIGFEQYLFTIKEDVTSRKIEITIAMNSSTMELEPVKVFAYKDEESLKRAILDMKVTATDDKERIELPGFYYGPRKPYKPSALGSPISFVANLFSKEEKERKLLEKAERDSDYRKMIKAKYNESLVMELTGLPEDEVSDFMNFCKIDESFVARSGAYEIALAVTQCMSRYQEKE